MADNVRMINVEGGSGLIPTGALQFGNDWPGLWIRGDDAIGLMVTIRTLDHKIKDRSDVDVDYALMRLAKYADIIERDVKVK